MASDPLDIPEFLKLTAEQRRAAWEGRALTVVRLDKLPSDQIFRRDMDARYARAEQERDERVGK